MPVHTHEHPCTHTKHMQESVLSLRSIGARRKGFVGAALHTFELNAGGGPALGLYAGGGPDMKSFALYVTTFHPLLLKEKFTTKMTRS